MKLSSLLALVGLLAACRFDTSGVRPRVSDEGWTPITDAGAESDVARPGDAARPRELGTSPELSLRDSAPKPDLPPKPDVTAPPLFSDDFAGPSSLLGDTGAWAVASGVMTQTSCVATPDAVIPNQSWGDITARVRFRGDQSCSSSYNQAGLAIRVVGASGCSGNKYYWCLADFDNDDLRIGKLSGACTTSTNYSIKTISPITLGVWYWMSFTAKGDTMTCTVWGGSLAAPQTHSWTDGGSPYSSGSAGLVTAGLEASFDDFTVTAP